MPPVLGILLAGGQSRRMGGGDKFFQKLGGHTILEHVIQNAQLQVDQLIINANGDPARFDSYQLTVVPDSLEGHQGPLAGVLTGLEWASAHMPDAEWIVTFAADAPFFPKQLVNDLKTLCATMLPILPAPHPAVGLILSLQYGRSGLKMISIMRYASKKFAKSIVGRVGTPLRILIILLNPWIRFLMSTGRKTWPRRLRMSGLIL